MSRAERWWRPAGQRRNLRPAVRSVRRGRYAAEQRYVDGFSRGLDAGIAEEAERRERQLRRFMEAIDADESGDPTQLDAFVGDDQAASDDLLDVAGAAGVTPLLEVDGGQLVDELETWLRRGGEAG